tara:strand:+ start:1378 stop:1905 length:528 start_codon:yes stop_codon:yes gene_type:complete
MIFETKRLIIRDFTESDIETVHHLVQEPEIYKYQTWGPNTLENTRSFIEMAISQQKDLPRKTYEMAIIEKESNTLIGAIGIRTYDHNKGDLGYWINKNLWGKGYATEATIGLIKYGFETLGLNKVSATADPNNQGSLKVLEKCKMQEEGYLKSDLLVRGEYRDSVLMAILRESWV